MTKRVLLSAPDVGPLEEAYVLDALRSGWVAPVGPAVDAFEREVADRVGTAHAVALSSGTAALHLALLSLGVGPGQVVIVPTLTFVATANAVIYTGAEPVFVDCEENTGNIDVGLLSELIPHLRATGRRIGAVIPVDLFGTCADYTRLSPLCAEAEVPIVEDAAEALGATHRGQPAASFGHVGALSFNGNKIISTSGGGMLVSDNPALIAQSRYLAAQARQPVPHYEHSEVGYNYRLSNVLAALGQAQLSRLDGMLTRRRLLRERYTKTFASVPGVRVLGDGDPGTNCWLTAIVVDPAEAGWSAHDLSAYLTKCDIETRSIWKPMHLQPIFTYSHSLLSGVANQLFRTGLTLPSGSGMRQEETERVFEAIGRFLEARQ